jgi:AcrR family transcriptional regulator
VISTADSGGHGVRQERAATTRAVLLTAAAKVFERKGYAGSSISDILKEGDLTRGALYFHFESKEELARAIVNEQFSWRELNTDLTANPVQQLIDMSYRFVEALQRDPMIRASIRLTLEQNTFASTDDSPYRGWLTAVEDLLRLAEQQKLLLAGVDPAAAAYLVTSSITGMQLISEATTGRADLRVRVGQAWGILLKALVRDDVVATIPSATAGAKRRTSAPRKAPGTTGR